MWLWLWLHGAPREATACQWWKPHTLSHPQCWRAHTVTLQRHTLTHHMSSFSPPAQPCFPLPPPLPPFPLYTHCPPPQVMNYVVNKLNEMAVEVYPHEVGFTPDTQLPHDTSRRYLELTCNGLVRGACGRGGSMGQRNGREAWLGMPGQRLKERLGGEGGCGSMGRRQGQGGVAGCAAQGMGGCCTMVQAAPVWVCIFGTPAHATTSQATSCCLYSCPCPTRFSIPWPPGTPPTRPPAGGALGNEHRQRPEVPVEALQRAGV